MVTLADACRIIGASAALFLGSAVFGQQTAFQGSVPAGVASTTPLRLTLQDAINRGKIGVLDNDMIVIFLGFLFRAPACHDANRIDADILPMLPPKILCFLDVSGRLLD